MVCLDLEGTIFPEIWEAVAETAGIPELMLTTRDEPDYDKLMAHRIGLLEKNGIRADRVIEIISAAEPFEGAAGFLDKLRKTAQVSVVSDTFDVFAGPIAKKLGNVNIFCNKLIIDEMGMISGYRMRCTDTKTAAIRAFQSLGYYVISAGDSFNDIGMIYASDAGFLINPPETVKEKCGGIRSVKDFAELYDAIAAEISKI